MKCYSSDYLGKNSIRARLIKIKYSILSLYKSLSTVHHCKSDKLFHLDIIIKVKTMINLRI